MIIVGIKWREQPAYLLLSAGRDPDAKLVQWMQAFAIRTGRPFFYEQGGEKLGFGSVEFQRDLLARLEHGEPMW